jgi:hypothetical protein
VRLAARKAANVATPRTSADDGNAVWPARSKLTDHPREDQPAESGAADEPCRRRAGDVDSVLSEHQHPREQWRHGPRMGPRIRPSVPRGRVRIRSLPLVDRRTRSAGSLAAVFYYLPPESPLPSAPASASPRPVARVFDS